MTYFSPNLQKIVDLFDDVPLTRDDVAKLLGTSTHNARNHLTDLASLGLTKCTRRMHKPALWVLTDAGRLRAKSGPRAKIKAEPLTMFEGGWKQPEKKT
jgi:predicted ArsR family transcriptional regulator